MGTSIDPLGLYIHATPPPNLPISIATALGPYLILVFLFCLLCGANLALYGLYLHLFSSRTGGDPLLLHLAVFLSVASNVVLAFYSAVRYYQCDLIELYATPGYDMNRIEAYVPCFHVLQGLSVAIGQVYFVVRIAKLFELRNAVTKIAIAVALVAIGAQFGLIVAFGFAFYSVGYKSHLLDPAKRLWVKEIISAWTLVFISLEIAMTVTTIVRLIRLRRQTTMDSARRVIFRLAVYSVQGQALLTAYSLSSLVLFSRSETGWYTPMYLLSGCLYTLVLLANLCYRSVVRRQMREVSECGSGETRRATGRFDLAAVKTYRTEDERVEELRMEAMTVRVEDWADRDGCRVDEDVQAEVGSVRSWQDCGELTAADTVCSRLSRHRRSHTTPVLPLVRISSKNSFRSLSDRFRGEH